MGLMLNIPGFKNSIKIMVLGTGFILVSSSSWKSQSNFTGEMPQPPPPVEPSEHTNKKNKPFYLQFSAKNNDITIVRLW